MSINHITVPTYEQIDHGIETLDAAVQSGNGLLPETPEKLIGHMLNVYEGVKPLLTTLSTLQILPRTWRKGLTLFIGALDAVADGLVNMSAGFKAGKDL